MGFWMYCSPRARKANSGLFIIAGAKRGLWGGWLAHGPGTRSRLSPCLVGQEGWQVQQTGIISGVCCQSQCSRLRAVAQQVLVHPSAAGAELRQQGRSLVVEQLGAEVPAQGRAMDMPTFPPRSSQLVQAKLTRSNYEKSVRTGPNDNFQGEGDSTEIGFEK